MYKRRSTRSDFKPPLKRPAADDSSLENSSASSSAPKSTRFRRSDPTPTLNRPETPETVESLNAKVETLREKNRQLDEEISDLRSKGFNESQLKLFIEKLNKYNALKDLGQSLLGQLAIREGVTTKALYPKYGLQLDE